ncbi:hypothetical protein GCM10027360_82180 [Amycolatopsis echigonensis]
MRMTVGLDRPDSGDALIRGKPYAELRFPLREVGALLDAEAVHPAARGSICSRWRAATESPRAGSRKCSRTVVASKRTGTFSLGVSQHC